LRLLAILEVRSVTPVPAPFAAVFTEGAFEAAEPDRISARRAFKVADCCRDSASHR
jgi:hypothetical protein